MLTHDPRQFVESLRDHLASHDKHLCFLFGAGTSAAVNTAPDPKPGETPVHIALIPAIRELTARCAQAVRDLGKPLADSWGLLLNECASRDLEQNIENILTRIRSKLDAIGRDERLLGLDQKQLEVVERTIRHTIARLATPDPESVPLKLPHNDFAFWVRQTTRQHPIEVFTTNYDLLIEQALENNRIPVFDGFVGSASPFFSPECVEDDELLPGPGWLRLWKIHGSVNWCETEYSGRKAIVRGQPTDTGEMIMPSDRKYDESRKLPFRSLIDRLGKVLSLPNALLLTSGFRFGDQHINAVILGALENRPKTHVVSLQHGDLSEESALVRTALRYPNLIVVGPNAAVINGRFGGWRLSSPVDTTTYQFMDVVFDCSFYPEEKNASLTGRMRMGDFDRFCKFLMQMHPTSGETE